MAELKRRFIRKEQAIQAGSLRVDYKLLWVVVLVLLSIVALIASSVADAVGWGVVFTVAAAVFYFGFIYVEPFENMQTTLLAKLHRKGVATTRNITGVSNWTSDQAILGEAFGEEPTKKRRQPYFKPLGRVEFCAFPTGVDSQPLGIVQDRTQGTRSAVLWTVGSSLLGGGSTEQARGQDAFARLLDLCGELEVHRFSWREQTLLGEPQQPDALVNTLRTAAQLEPIGSPNLDVLTRRTAEMGEKSVVHRTTMVFTISKKGATRQAKSLGSAEAVLMNLLGSFYSAAMGNDGDQSPLGLRAASFLTYNDLVMETRLGLDPVYAQPLWESWEGPQGPNDLLNPAFAWPGYADFKSSPDWARVGQTFHVGLFLDEYNPRGTLPEEYWKILEVRVPKVVTTVVQLVPQRHAERRAQWASNSAFLGNAEAPRVTASDQVSAERAMEHESEIATGQVGQVGRLRTYIDVTGATVEEALANAALVTSAAMSGRSTLNPLTGRQLEGIAAVVPFGRGLATGDLPKWV